MIDVAYFSVPLHIASCNFAQRLRLKKQLLRTAIHAELSVFETMKKYVKHQAITLLRALITSTYSRYTDMKTT